MNYVNIVELSLGLLISAFPLPVDELPRTLVWPHSLTSTSLTCQHLVHLWHWSCTLLSCGTAGVNTTLRSLWSAPCLCPESTDTPCPGSGQRAEYHHPEPAIHQSASRDEGQQRFIYPSERKWCDVSGQAHSSYNSRHLHPEIKDVLIRIE